MPGMRRSVSTTSGSCFSSSARPARRVVGARDLVAVLAQQRLQRGRGVHLVVDDDDPSLVAHRLRPPAAPRRPVQRQRDREGRAPARRRWRRGSRRRARSTICWTMERPRPVPLRLGRHEELEDVEALGQARPGVAHHQRARCPSTSPLSTVTTPPSGIASMRVAHEVDHDLLHLLGVHAELRAAARRRAAARSVTPGRARLGAQQAHDLVDQRVEVRRLVAARGRCARRAGSRRPGRRGAGSPRG